jgi:hypothetical protein
MYLFYGIKLTTFCSRRMGVSNLSFGASPTLATRDQGNRHAALMIYFVRASGVSRLVDCVLKRFWWRDLLVTMINLVSSLARLRSIIYLDEVRVKFTLTRDSSLILYTEPIYLCLVISCYRSIYVLCSSPCYTTCAATRTCYMLLG